MGKVISTGLNIATGGAIGDGPLGSSLGDTLFGAKDPGTAASQVNIYNPNEQKLLDSATGQYQDALNNNAQITQNQGAQMEKQAIQGGADAERSAKQLVAQRGLGNSSVGIGAILGANHDTANKVADIHAGLPGMQLDNLNKINSGVGNLLGTQSNGTIYNKAVASQGRLPGGIAGTIVSGLGVAAKAGAA